MTAVTDKAPETMMTTRRIVLTDHQEAVIRSLISGGRYRNADEVLHHGLSMIERCEASGAFECQPMSPGAELCRSAIQNRMPETRSGLDCWITQLRPSSGTG